MIETIKKIIENVLTALYQPFGFSVILAVLFMFLYLFARENGWRVLAQRWVNCFKKEISFRRVFFLSFYVSMIMFRTLLNRIIWLNPLENVIGVWGLWNQNGDLTTEVIENLILFIPFTILLLWSFHREIIGQPVKMFKTVWKATIIVFGVSVLIEFLQLFLRIGTFQLSDLFYNTLGGLIGGLIYWCGYKLAHRNEK